jgi:thiamine biosynthesis lipoprotein ApbE
MSSSPREPALLSIARRHMAADFEFEVVVDPVDSWRAESVLEEAHARVAEIEDRLTEFREPSTVFRLNRAPAGTWFDLDPILGDALALAKTFVTISRGMYDPFSKSVGGASFQELEIDVQTNRVRKHRDELRLGFGAFGKGYALDRAREVLAREGLEDFRLGSGGSSWLFGGFDPHGRPWEIAWAWDRDSEGDYQGHRYRLPGGKPLAIGVSGILEQGNHLLRNGEPVPAGIRSAFYCGRSAAEADALSTALFVGASVEGESFLTTLEDRIREPRVAYVDLKDGMFYNRSFETTFLREGRIQ